MIQTKVTSSKCRWKFLFAGCPHLKKKLDLSACQALFFLLQAPPLSHKISKPALPPSFLPSCQTRICHTAGPLWRQLGQCSRLMGSRATWAVLQRPRTTETETVAITSLNQSHQEARTPLRCACSFYLQVLFLDIPILSHSNSSC